MINNGNCDAKCMNDACGNDGDDCKDNGGDNEINPDPVCPEKCADLAGDKVCDVVCNIKSCNFDGGDCVE
jgi:hypothetical protein